MHVDHTFAFASARRMHLRWARQERREGLYLLKENEKLLILQD